MMMNFISQIESIQYWGFAGCVLDPFSICDTHELQLKVL